MFENAVEGFDKLLEDTIPEGHIIIVKGVASSLKTIFSTWLVNSHIKEHGEFALFATIDENADSHAFRMERLGMELSDNLHISDYTEIRSRFEGQHGHPGFLRMIEGVLKFFKNEKGEKFRCFVLDSLGGVYSLIGEENIRSKMYNFFKTLRDMGLTSLVIMEEFEDQVAQHVTGIGSEVFLADGIIELGMYETREDVKRYIQIKKMRACKYDMRKYAIELSYDGFMVGGPLFL